MRAAPRTLRFSLSAVLGLVLLCGLTGATQMKSDDAQNRNVRIHNQTGWSMTRIYASAGGAWSENLLSGSALTPGRSVVVRLDNGSGGCRYTLRAEFDNGETLRRDGVNACQVADYYFTR